MPSIYVASGIEEGSCYGFAPGDAVFIVGRAPNCHIVLTDPLVSRQHCRIERSGPTYKLVDLGSHNGVYVNEQKLEPDSTRELKFGDSIRLGETELVLQEAAPDDEGELAGRRLGGYQLVKRIGSGGMGEVYKAVQIALGRPVAIKILSPDLTEDASFVQRFMTEARAAGKLNHPNVAQVHEVGESDGIYYYSMEYLSGGSVQDRIRGGRKLAVAEAVKIALGAARALEYAEKQGVIHCDIKPDNLMLTEEGEVRLADLGIARTVASRGAKVRQEGGVLGSPHYMAPEQARGEPIDRRVDIYSLGASFYRMISGRTPFTGKNAREIMEKQVYEDPPALRSLDPNIPQEVAQVIVKMMKKRPEKRYQSAREVSADLAVLQEELAAAALAPGERPSRLMTSVRRRVRARSGAGIGIVLVALALAGAAGYVLWPKLFGRDQRPEVNALQALMAKADEAAGRRDLAAALDLYRQAAEAAPPGSGLRERASRRVQDLEAQLAARQLDQASEEEWARLEAATKTVRDLREMAGRYEAFAAAFPVSPRAEAARTAAKRLRNQHRAAADAAVKALEAGEPALIAACKFGDLGRRWGELAAAYAGLPAGQRAAARAAEVPGLADKELAAARAAADAELAAGRLDNVLGSLERLQKADLPAVVAEAGRLVQEYLQKVSAARRELERAEERRKAAAACQALAEEALALVRAYEYIKARGKFSEAQLAYRREGFEAEAEALRKVAAECHQEQELFLKLVDFAGEGGLGSARVRLADGFSADIISADSEGLTCTRGMKRDARVAWRELPAASVFSLLRRPKLTAEERLNLARFALRRGLAAEAKEEVEKALAAEPDRKNEAAALLEAIDKALKGAGAKAPEEKKP